MVRIARIFLWSSLLLGAVTAWAEGPEITPARDLRAEGAAVRSQRVPLMIMFSAEYCGWCARMEEEFLKPMLRNRDYDDKVMIRKVVVDPAFALTDFDGRRITGAELAARYAVSVTPTLVFLDGQGDPIADKMVGLTTPDYFGGYLDAAIDTALGQIRKTSVELASGG